MEVPESRHDWSIEAGMVVSAHLQVPGDDRHRTWLEEIFRPGHAPLAGHGELFRRCLSQELRVVAQATLMAIGLYDEPAGPYLPSILYSCPRRSATERSRIRAASCRRQAATSPSSPRRVSRHAASHFRAETQHVSRA
jgi:hypothetical protein